MRGRGGISSAKQIERVNSKREATEVEREIARKGAEIIFNREAARWWRRAFAREKRCGSRRADRETPRSRARAETILDDAHDGAKLRKTAKPSRS